MGNTPQAVRRLKLTDDLTIYHAAALKAQLLDEVVAHPALELDLSQVAALDTAGVQILLLAKREAAEAGKTLSIVAHSDAVQDVINLCNLGAQFGDPVVIPAHPGT